MESAPTANGKCQAPMDGRAAARLQFWKHPCFENAAKRPPALPKAGGAAFASFLRVSRTPAPARRCGPKFRQGRQPFSGAGATKKRPLSKRPLFLEVTTRFELVNEGFADPCLTTWPRHHINQIPAVGPVSVICGAADEARTRYLHLGKVALYQMSYGRKLESLACRLSPGDECYFTASAAFCQAVFSTFSKNFSQTCAALPGAFSGQPASSSLRSTW